MKLIAKYLINLVAFVVLLTCSITIFGTPDLSAKQSDNFMDYASAVGFHDGELAYSLFFLALHALLALVVLIFINIVLKKWRQKKSTTTSA